VCLERLDYTRNGRLYCKFDNFVFLLLLVIAGTEFAKFGKKIVFQIEVAGDRRSRRFEHGKRRF